MAYVVIQHATTKVSKLRLPRSDVIDRRRQTIPNGDPSSRRVGNEEERKKLGWLDKRSGKPANRVISKPTVAALALEGEYVANSTTTTTGEKTFKSRLCILRSKWRRCTSKIE